MKKSAHLLLIYVESRTHAGGGVFSWELPQETPSHSAQPETAPVPVDSIPTKSATQKLFDSVGANGSPDEITIPDVPAGLEAAPSRPLEQSADWYNITAIGKDEPLEKTPELAQRPSFRRSVSGKKYLKLISHH